MVVTNYLLTGMILQVSLETFHKKSLGSTAFEKISPMDVSELGTLPIEGF